MTNILILGERRNTRDDVHARELSLHSPCEWFCLSLEQGLYEKEWTYIPSVALARARLLELSIDVDACVRMNLLPPSGVCGAWDAREALRLADEWKRWAARLFVNHKVILLGARLRDAFGLRPVPWFVQAFDTYIPVPHPSGQCRVWNDEDAVAIGRILIEEVLR